MTVPHAPTRGVEYEVTVPHAPDWGLFDRGVSACLDARIEGKLVDSDVLGFGNGGYGSECDWVDVSWGVAGRIRPEDLAPGAGPYRGERKRRWGGAGVWWGRASAGPGEGVISDGSCPHAAPEVDPRGWRLGECLSERGGSPPRWVELHNCAYSPRKGQSPLAVLSAKFPRTGLLERPGGQA